MTIYIYVRNDDIIASSTSRREGLAYDHEFEVVGKGYYEYESPKKEG